MDFSNFPNGITSMGVPVFGGGIGPIMGKSWFVATTGSDDNPGNEDTPFLTITKALTVQIADSSGLGDVIWVLPGTYAESITGNMTKVQIIGVGRAGMRPMAKVHPTTSYGYTGEMVDSGLNNLEILAPSAPTSPTAAVVVTTNTTTLKAMNSSYIDNCFLGAECNWSTYRTIGICIGAFTAANTTYEFADHSRIANNTFASPSNRAFQPEFAISVGASNTSQAGAEYKGITDCDIVGNRIFAGRTAIKVSCGAVGTTGTTIRYNTIGSLQSAQGPQEYGIQFNSAAADQLCMVIGNHINSGTAAIYNHCTTGNVLENWIAAGGTESFAETFTSMGA